MESMQQKSTHNEETRPRIAQLGQELEEEVKKLLEEEKERTYSWLERFNINMWEFRDKNPALMRSLEDELDLSQWEHIAEELGLSNQQIERCRKCQTYTRAVFNTLEECPQYQDLTVKSFLEILLQHDRRDILLKLEEYGRLGTGTERCTTKTFTLSIQSQPEVLVASSNLGCTVRKSKQSEFQARVLLIHSQDTKEDALQLVSQLRNGMGGKRLSVLHLQESENRTVISSLRSDPWNSILMWFVKVDAVVPVLSPQFLHQIQNRDRSRERALETRYNRFIYSLVLDKYVEYDSKNIFCRAVCPARFLNQMADNELVKHSGLFKYHWNCSSDKEVKECAIILHEGALKLRKMKRRWRTANTSEIIK